MIEINDLHKRYGEVEVLRGISMTVERGEVAVLLGPSGGGKSTLLRTINGLETFEQGKITVAQSLELTPAAFSHKNDAALLNIRQQVGMVFQQFNLFPHLSVLDNVTIAPRTVLHKLKAQADVEALELLKRVGLDHKAHVSPTTLSGGQQQRVAIARALAMRPKAILFDEPTSALDPRMTAEVVSVMADLAKEGQTMIVVTHGMGFARSVAHTVYVMAEGRIAEKGPPQQIFEDPQQEVTRAFVSEAKKG